MPERLQDDCDCHDADLDILTGLETCYACGSRRYLSSDELRHREELEAQWHAEYDRQCQEWEQEHHADQGVSSENQVPAHECPDFGDGIPF